MLSGDARSTLLCCLPATFSVIIDPHSIALFHRITPSHSRLGTTELHFQESCQTSHFKMWNVVLNISSRDARVLTARVLTASILCWLPATFSVITGAHPRLGTTQVHCQESCQESQPMSLGRFCHDADVEPSPEGSSLKCDDTPAGEGVAIVKRQHLGVCHCKL